VVDIGRVVYSGTERHRNPHRAASTARPNRLAVGFVAARFCSYATLSQTAGQTHRDLAEILM
jgi:hypothetical protein